MSKKIPPLYNVWAYTQLRMWSINYVVTCHLFDAIDILVHYAQVISNFVCYVSTQDQLYAFFSVLLFIGVICVSLFVYFFSSIFSFVSYIITWPCGSLSSESELQSSTGSFNVSVGLLAGIYIRFCVYFCISNVHECHLPDFHIIYLGLLL